MPESEPAVIVEADGPVLTVTLNRPEKRNAVNSEVMCRLYDAWNRLDADEAKALSGYFQKFEHLRQKFQFLNFRVGGREVSAGGPAGKLRRDGVAVSQRPLARPVHSPCSSASLPAGRAA